MKVNLNEVIDALDFTNDEIRAYIADTKIYRAWLKANANELNGFYCSCPYIENGEYICKHIAALLYYLNENDVLKLEISINEHIC